MKTFNLARQQAAAVIFIAGITIFLFFRTGSFQFVNLDDMDYVTQNPHVLSGISPKNIVSSFTTFHAANWHPLTWLSHMLDCQLYGVNPAGHHLTNVVIHATSAALLFLFLCAATGALWQSVFVATLFAIHPLHVESVAWVSERKDVLSALFLMLTLLLYSRYVQRPSVPRYCLAILAFALGLMAKPMLVTLPFVLLLLDYWPLGRYSTEGAAEGSVIGHGGLARAAIFRRLLWEKIPFLAMSLASCVITIYAQQKQAVVSLDRLPIGSRIANALVAYVTYLGKTFWPVDLAAYYPLPLSMPHWQWFGAAGLLAGITAFAVMKASRSPYLPVGWFWFLGMLVPVIGLVQVGAQAMADRYTYLPLIGIFIMIAWGAPALFSGLPYRRIMLPLAAGLSIVGLTIVAWRQTSYWKNDVALFGHAVAVTSDNYFARTFLGLALQLQGKDPEAYQQLAEAVRINPRFAKAHFGLGISLVKLGRVDEAITHYRMAVQLEPSFEQARINLANALAGKGESGEAISLLSRVVESNPRNAEACYNLALTLEGTRRLQEAIRYYREALRINPGCAECYNNMGGIFFSQGDEEEAISCFSEALRVNPAFTMAGHNLQAVRVQQRLRHQQRHEP